MVETDGMTDLVHKSIAQVVDVPVAVKTSFPSLPGVKADQRLFNYCNFAAVAGRRDNAPVGQHRSFGWLDEPAHVGVLSCARRHVRKSSSERHDLGTDEYVGCFGVGSIPRS